MDLHKNVAVAVVVVVVAVQLWVWYDGSMVCFVRSVVCGLLDSGSKQPN